ncbi:hypothetical protein ACSXDQ_03025 [Clostridium perfringens]
MDKQLMRKRINEVIKTDATVVELQDFMATHMPFKKLKYYIGGIDAIKGKELTEEEFFYEFIEDTKDKHNFIVVQGDNGSGKSHFIRWIKNKIESEELFPNDVVILIERSQNTLQATIKQLINNKIIQEFLSEEEKIKLKNTGVELSEEKFTSMINYNFIIEAENEEDDEDCILKSAQRKGLVELLKDEIIQEEILFDLDGPIRRISNKLIMSEDNSINEIDIRFVESDFELNSDILMKLKDNESNRKAVRFAENLKDDRRGIRSLVAKYLNEKIDMVIQRTIKLNAADLNSILEKIRYKLKELDKNLMLFIEDITAFTGVDKGVIESLIVEHREDNGLCRLFSFVGVTTGYYQSHFPDNLKDRVTSRVFIDRDSLFDNNEDVIELAARYINAINVPKEDLKKWISKGAVDSDLPIKDSGVLWDKYKDKSNREFSLYPLTEKAIVNLYKEIQDKRTPRRFIKNILLPIMLHYVNDNKFPSGLEDFEAEIVIPKFKNELLNRKIDSEVSDEVEKSRTKCLLRIWGDGTIDCLNKNNLVYIGSIDERIFDEFKVTKIIGNKILNNENNSVKKNEVKTDISNYSGLNLNVEKDIIKTQLEKIDKRSKELSKKDKEMDSIKEDLERWFVKNENLKIHPKIREYVCSFIKEGINWDLEDIPYCLVNDAISLNNLKIRGQQGLEETTNNIIWIEKTEDDYYFLLSLMKYIVIGRKTWNYENAQDDILIVAKWLENNKERIINYVSNGNDVNYDMYKYAMAAEIYGICINKTIMKYGNEISIKEMNIYQLYNIIINKFQVKDEEELINILGTKFSKTYFDKRGLINTNHDFILDYYNCPLGKGKSIFLDASEILKTINKISKEKFYISNLSDIQFKNGKELWKKPYELLKKLYGTNLNSAISERINYIKLNDKDYIESFDEVGVINNFFDTLDNNNIMYDGKIKLEFDKLFEDTIKYNNYISYKNKIKESDNIDLIDKIYLLKSSIPKQIKKYNDVLGQIEHIISKQEEKYRNKVVVGATTSEQVDEIVNECLLKIEKIENDLKSVEEGH